MKKSLCLAVCILLCLCTFSACSNNDTESKAKKVDHSVNVKNEALKGQIPELEFMLGDGVEDVREVMFKMAAGMSYDEYCDNMRSAGYTPDGTEFNSYVIKTVSGNHTVLAANYNEQKNMVYCMYNNDNSNGGISAIAVIGDAYGFDGNTLKSYVKSAVDGNPKDTPAAGELNFLPKESDGATCLTYEFGAYKLEFYFSSYDTLATTVIYNTATW